MKFENWLISLIIIGIDTKIEVIVASPNVLHSFTFAFNSILKIVVQPNNGIFQIILYLKTSAVLLMILF